jgi:phosphoglucosamine mutase
MLQQGSEIGGEQSGHIILRRFANTGDGLLTALQVLGIMRYEQAPLSTLLADFRRFPQVLVNVHVARKPPLAELKSIQELVEDARQTLGQESRILVRYSGTEPLARVMIEGQEQHSINQEAHRIAEALKSLLN